jgi:replication factor A1
MPFKVGSKFSLPARVAELMFRLIIILGLEIVDWKGDKIGNPSNLEQSTTSAAAAAPTPTTGAGAGAGGASRLAPARAAGGGGGGAAGRSGKDMGPIFPIEGLSPYQNK